MAAKKTKSEATGTVQARHQTEAERQATAAADRAELIKQTKAEQKATADRLANKPTDTRKLA
jgi:hypothetical protein